MKSGFSDGVLSHNFPSLKKATEPVCCQTCEKKPRRLRILPSRMTMCARDASTHILRQHSARADQSLLKIKAQFFTLLFTFRALRARADNDCLTAHARIYPLSDVIIMHDQGARA